jgi:PleD family two-component response regulator
MKLDGEIILIDNDKFEYDFLIEALKRLNYDVGVVYLQTAKEGFDYLKQTKKDIFLIISEIDFDGMDGLALKKAINEEANTVWKSIPFVFIANEATKETVDAAYKHNIHGLFRKPPKLDSLTDLFSVIIRYWIMNLHPNKDESFYAVDWYNAST